MALTQILAMQDSRKYSNMPSTRSSIQKERKKEKERETDKREREGGGGGE